MHISSTSYSRITFGNVADLSTLRGFAKVLSLESTDHPEIFDLVQCEDFSTTPKGIIESLGKAYSLDPSCDIRNGYDPDFSRVLKTLRNKARSLKYTPHTCILEDSYRHSESTDIIPEELFDIMTVMGGEDFTVESISNQWAVFSNAVVPGSHFGGSSIVKREFSVLAVKHVDELETIANGFNTRDFASQVEYYFEQFIDPLISEHAIKDDEFRQKLMGVAVERWSERLLTKQ